MGSQRNFGIRTFRAGAALEQFRRVKLSSGEVVYAGAGEAFIGVTEDAVASGESVAVRLKNDSGTFKVVASAAVTAGASLYGAADGKVSVTVSGAIVYEAIEAASGNNSVIEVIPKLREAA